MHLVEEKAIFLEPTDDERPKLERNLQNSLSTLSKPLSLSIKDNKTSNETQSISNERRRTYQQQFSIPLYHQQKTSLHFGQSAIINSSSITNTTTLLPRRRRTSVIEPSISEEGIAKAIQDSINYQLNQQKQQHHQQQHFDVNNLLLSTKDIVLRRCGQSEPIDFKIEYSKLALQQCRKIGEGVYGEVFMNKKNLNINNSALRGSNINSNEVNVLKIIPIEGTIEINGEPQKKFDEILSEIVIASELSRLRNDKEFMTSGFVEVKKIRCVKGCYPEHLIDLWELYRDNYGTENDHPEIFPEGQLYIVLELENGGQDLEAFTFENALQSYSAFLQVALSLAVAESKFKFEHRDLHWGNILLSSTKDKEIIYRLNGKEFKIPTYGVKATIIDYTLSRMIFDGCCFYNDLSNDNDLFSATGDYQFDIYRLMKKSLENDWERHQPYTNILWLHYVIDKMISGARYHSSKNKKHRNAMQTMMQVRDELLDYKSASDYVVECLN